MPQQLTIYTVAERKPQHCESIIWYRKESCFGYYGFNPGFIEVCYQWIDTDFTGVCYDGEDEQEMLKEGYTLQILFDGYVAEPDWKYSLLDEWEEVLDKGQS